MYFSERLKMVFISILVLRGMIYVIKTIMTGKLLITEEMRKASHRILCRGRYDFFSNKKKSKKGYA